MPGSGGSWFFLTMSRRVSTLFVLLVMCVATPAQAQDALPTITAEELLAAVRSVESTDLAVARIDAMTDAPPREFRWTDGPRDVPRPRGAAMLRAQHLGLGTHDAAESLLTHSPDPRWVSAARQRPIPTSPHPARRPRGRGAETHRGSDPDLAPLLWPVDGARYGRGYGFTRRGRPDLLHKGIDVAGRPGDEVHAVADGIVAYSDNGLRGYGNCVLVVHPNGWVSLYAHLKRTTVQAGWRVHRGERIGLVGSTGMARGPHLHWELRAGGRAFDAEALFAAIPFRHVRHRTASRPPSRAP